MAKRAQQVRFLIPEFRASHGGIKVTLQTDSGGQPSGEEIKMPIWIVLEHEKLTAEELSVAIKKDIRLTYDL